MALTPAFNVHPLDLVVRTDSLHAQTMTILRMT